MYGKMGVQTLTDGTSGPLRLNAEGALVVEIQGAKYAEDCRRGRLFSVCNQTAVALTAALATAYTGLVIMNPAGSGKNVELLGMGYATTEFRRRQRKLRRGLQRQTMQAQAHGALRIAHLDIAHRDGIGRGRQRSRCH